MKIYAASDHAGFSLKQQLVAEARRLGHEVEDLGPAGGERVDYPDYGAMLARRVAREHGSRGLLCCGSGIGIAIAANKIPGIRAATCWDEVSARLCRQHNDANILSIGERLVVVERAVEMLRIFLETEFEGGHHAVRVQKLNDLP